MRRAKRGRWVWVMAGFALVLAWGGSALAGGVSELDLSRADGLGTVITTNGQGEVRIQVKGPSIVCLGVIENPKVEQGILIYKAEVKAVGLKGTALLEMWCDFPGKGEFFSRGVKQSVSGDQDWKTISTPFILKKGQKPSRVMLSIMVQGQGEVWVRKPRLGMQEAH